MPTLRNECAFAVELVPLIDRVGRNVATVIAKATYQLRADGTLDLAAVQEPVTFVDLSFNNDLIWASDLADYKPSADVILVRPVGLRHRVPLDGRKFTVIVGSLTIAGAGTIDWPYGPVPRDREPRRSLAGTYDAAWADQRMPLLPVDFDPRHNQVAPPAQRLPSLTGGERFALENVYGLNHRVEGTLPGRAVVIAGSVMFDYFTEVATLDTVGIWMDRPQITLVWRHSICPKQKIEEIGRVHVYTARLSVTRELYGAP